VELPRIARKPVEVDVTATLPNHDPATISGVECALCDHGGPTPDTVWVPAAYNTGTRVGGITLIGREAADKSNGLVLTMARAGLWAKPTGTAAVDAGFIDTIEGL
jgi:hypothetical protein